MAKSCHFNSMDDRAQTNPLNTQEELSSLDQSTGQFEKKNHLII